MTGMYLSVENDVKIPPFGPVAQLVRAGDSSNGAFIIERYEMNGMNSGKP